MGIKYNKDLADKNTKTFSLIDYHTRIESIYDSIKQLSAIEILEPIYDKDLIQYDYKVHGSQDKSRHLAYRFVIKGNLNSQVINSIVNQYNVMWIIDVINRVLYFIDKVSIDSLISSNK